MNYYERHLGDYAKDTAHLTMLEHGAYSLLLDRYYATEKGIPDEQIYRICRARTKEEKKSCLSVLQEFFFLENGVWRHGRVEEEIEKATRRINAAKENGRNGGRPKKEKTVTQEKPGGFPVGSENETQEKAYQAPSTKHHTPDSKQVNQPPVGNLTTVGGGGISPGELTKPMVKAGIRCNPGHPDILALAAAGCTPETVQAAIAEAKLTKPSPPQGYVVAILKRWQSEPTVAPGNAPNAPAKVKGSPPWWASEAGIKAEGNRLGMTPRPGEDWNQFKGRINEKLAERGAP